MGFFFGRPPFLPFSRAAAAFFLLFIEPSATAAGFLGMSTESYLFLGLSLCLEYRGMFRSFDYFG